MIPALAHVDTWIFDLDQTLYPHEAEVMALVEGKMTAFVARETGLSQPEAYDLQKKYLSEHGTTLAGLMAYHNIDPYTFLNEVHDVSLDKLLPDAGLNALQNAPRIVRMHALQHHQRPAGRAHADKRLLKA